MAEFPALPLFTDAFIADTMHLNALQTGAYLMLLMCAWRTPDCRLPNDDKLLARFARMDMRTWNANRDVIMSFWKQDDAQKWYQARLVDERKHVAEKRSKNVAAGRASALKRHETGLTDVQPKSNQNPTNPNPNPILPKGSKKAPLYSDLFEQAWKAYPTTQMMSKAEGWKSWQKADRPEPELLNAVKAYAQEISKPNAPYAAHFATFFNQHRYEGFLTETEAALATAGELEAMANNLPALERTICNALSPAVYRAWLNEARIRDGPEVEIIFNSDFRRSYFQERLAGKAEKAIGKTIRCRTGT